MWNFLVALKLLTILIQVIQWRTFRHTKIFFINNRGTDYISFGTYLCLLFIVAFDIKALGVPWHQFVYTLFIPRDRLVIQPASFKSSSFAKCLSGRCSFIFVNGKNSEGARSGLYGIWSKMSQWNAHAAQQGLCLPPVGGRALSCNRTFLCESSPLWQDNLRSNRPAENE